MNHYEALGIEPTATGDEVKAAFRRKSSELHPDNAPRHAHLKAQWRQGQKWETLVENCTQWVPVSDCGYSQPLWDGRQEYRQCADQQLETP